MRENNYNESHHSPRIDDEQECNGVTQGISEIMNSINKLDDLDAGDTINNMDQSMIEATQEDQFQSTFHSKLVGHQPMHQHTMDNSESILRTHD